MLQQTQADRVAPRYEEWMGRWPTAAALAAAPVGEAIAAWSGLGYNRRAVNLHRAAVVVAGAHGGVVPDDVAGLMALPGIGAYTARAVLAFAFERSVGVVDVNAARVLARTTGRRLRPAEAQAVADRLVAANPDGPWAHNQAMLDLGATMCRARRPACDACPLRPAGVCAWHRSGGPGVTADPAIGSAATTRPQPAFAGSDRQGRGRLVAAMSRAPLDAASLAAAAGWPDDAGRAGRVAADLVADGLAELGVDGRLRLPGWSEPDRTR